MYLRSLSLLAAVVVVLAQQAPAKKLAMAWFAGWHAADFPLSKVSWEKYDQMFYAFATTTPDAHLLSLQPSDVELLPQFVDTAHQHGVKASLSIGGWTGSRWFSSNLATSSNRSVFIDSVLALVQKYGLDGVDFDWEFPDKEAQSLECNTVSTNDTANFLAFLRAFRARPQAKSLVLSAPTYIVPFNVPPSASGSTSGPSTNLSAFADVLDFISIMNYDVWKPTTSLTVGPNAPLNDSCVQQQPPGRRNGSAVGAVGAWNAAGIPYGQIVLGVPAYGHSFNVARADAFENSGSSGRQLALYPPFNATGQPMGGRWDNAPGVDACGNAIGAGGVWQFSELLGRGYVDASGGAAAGAVAFRYDDCSQTPYVYDESGEIMISYDDPRSFAAKGAFIKDMGLRGFAMWEAGGDSGDLLLDAIINATIYGDPSLSNGPPSQSNSPSSTIRSFSSSRSFVFSLVLALALGVVGYIL